MTLSKLRLPCRKIRRGGGTWRCIAYANWELYFIYIYVCMYRFFFQVGCVRLLDGQSVLAIGFFLRGSISMS
jgi:hypothetical protein